MHLKVVQVYGDTDSLFLLLEGRSRADVFKVWGLNWL